MLSFQDIHHGNTFKFMKTRNHLSIIVKKKIGCVYFWVHITKPLKMLQTAIKESCFVYY